MPFLILFTLYSLEEEKVSRVISLSCTLEKQIVMRKMIIALYEAVCILIPDELYPSETICKLFFCGTTALRARVDPHKGFRILCEKVHRAMKRPRDAASRIESAKLHPLICTSDFPMVPKWIRLFRGALVGPLERSTRPTSYGIR